MRDMNSAKVGVAGFATVTVSVNADTGAKTTAAEAATAETKCRGIQLADVLNGEGVSPTA